MMRRLLRRWWVRWIVLPLLALFAAHAGWTLVLKWKFERRLDALRAGGAPVDFRDLAPPPVPDADNGALVLNEAHRWYEANLLPEPPLFPSFNACADGDLEEEDRAAVRQWVAKGAPYADLLARVAAKPAFRQDLDWDAGSAMVVPTLPQMREARDYLCARVRVAERATPEELRDLAVLLDLEAKLESHTVIPVLAGWNMADTGAEALSVLARSPGFDAREARALLDGRFAASDDPSRLRDALRGDRVAMLSFSRQWIDAKGPAEMLRELNALEGDQEDREKHTLLDLFLASPLGRPLAYRDGLRLLDLMDRALPLVDLPPREALLAAEELREEYRRGPPNIVSHLYAVMPAKVFQVRQRHRARIRVARVGLALLELRQETGAWPGTLDAVVPLVGADAILDPYNGRRLEYVAGARVEAAVPILHEELRTDDEIVWRFER